MRSGRSRTKYSLKGKRTEREIVKMEASYEYIVKRWTKEAVREGCTREEKTMMIAQMLKASDLQPSFPASTLSFF